MISKEAKGGVVASPTPLRHIYSLKGSETLWFLYRYKKLKVAWWSLEHHCAVVYPIGDRAPLPVHIRTDHHAAVNVTLNPLRYLRANLPLFHTIDLIQAQNQAPKLGAGVKVAVLDSGVDLHHPAFQGRLAPVDQWYDFIDDDAVPQEPPSQKSAYGHGTAVAGIVAQVAPQATLLPLRVLQSDGSGDTDQLIEAVWHALQMNTHILNISISPSEEDPNLSCMLDYALSQGVLLVVSAGNSGRAELSPLARYAAKRPGALAVGSASPRGQLSKFSSYGKELTLLAPGERIQSAFPDEGLIFATGTSFATALVSGSLALALAEQPHISSIKSPLTQTLLTSATPFPTAQKAVPPYTYLNLAELIRTIHNPALSPPSRRVIPLY